MKFGWPEPEKNDWLSYFSLVTFFHIFIYISPFHWSIAFSSKIGLNLRAGVVWQDVRDRQGSQSFSNRSNIACPLSNTEIQNCTNTNTKDPTLPPLPCFNSDNIPLFSFHRVKFLPAVLCASYQITQISVMSNIFPLFKDPNFTNILKSIFAFHVRQSVNNVSIPISGFGQIETLYSNRERWNLGCLVINYASNKSINQCTRNIISIIINIVITV